MSSPPLPKPSILFVAYYFPPINAVGALRPGRFAKYLNERGYSSIVVSSRSEANLVNTESVQFVPDPDHPASLGTRLGAFAGRVAHRLVTRHSDRLDWAAHAVAAAEPYLRQSKANVIFSSSPPVSTHIACLQLKKRYPVKWIADFRDPLAGSPFRKGYRLEQFDRRMEAAIFTHADFVTTVTDAIAREWEQRYPQWKHKIRVLWNGFDPEEVFGPLPPPPRDHRLLMHVGDLYGDRHPGLLLSAWDRLIARGEVDPKALRLELVGPIETSGMDANPAFGRLKQLGVLSYNNVRVPRAEAMHAIAKADYLLLLDLNPQNVGHTVPAKLFDYLRTGHPMLAFTAGNSVVGSILGKAGVPNVCIDPNEPENVVDEKVSRFFALRTDPVLPNQWFWENFDGRRQAGVLAGLLDELNDGRR